MFADEMRERTGKVVERFRDDAKRKLVQQVCTMIRNRADNGYYFVSLDELYQYNGSYECSEIDRYAWEEMVEFFKGEGFSYEPLRHQLWWTEE